MRRIRRRITAALAAALLSTMLLGGTATAATAGGASALNVVGCYRNTFGLCVWTSTTNFSSRWTYSIQHTEHQTYWQFSGFQMDATVRDGKLCKVGTNNCTDWMFTATATFVNASGVQVAKHWISSYPGGCYDAAYGIYSRYFAGCKILFDVPITATKVKLHWAVGMKCGTCPFQTPWWADRTFTL